MTDARGAEVTAWLPDVLYAGGRFHANKALVCDSSGVIVSLVDAEELRRAAGTELRNGETCNVALGDESRAVVRIVRLRGRALLPGMVNAHSHAFQRVIRGRTEHRSSHARDSFWTWREMMYGAAERLTPEEVYDASRMAFLEMALGGITSVGEFHYLHRAPGGGPYNDPNELAWRVVRAARDVGLRIALLRVFYARSGYGQPPNPRQSRFMEPDAEIYLENVERLRRELEVEDDVTKVESAARSEAKRLDEHASSTRVAWVGVAPHSVRAVTMEGFRAVGAYAERHGLPVHSHVAEQPAELSACLEEHGRTPVRLLADEGLLNERFTGVHAVHVTQEEVRALAASGATVCACPTTERNLGDGIVPADLMFEADVRLALGTDSHAQIDLLEDARELEYHLRLSKLERNVLASPPSEVSAAVDEGSASSLAARLFECATLGGARSTGHTGGEIEPGRPADFFTIDLNDPSVAGAGPGALLPALVFSLSRAAVREVFVGGRAVVEEGRHADQDEIVRRFNDVQHGLWGENF